MNQLVIFILCCNLTFSCGLKLEHWSDPIIEGSIKPNALADASRKPKLFFGVRKRNVLSVFPLVFEYLFIFWLHIGFLIFRFAGSSIFRTSGISFFVRIRKFELLVSQNSRNSNIELLKTEKKFHKKCLFPTWQ